jgi:hypothetical protein
MAVYSESLAARSVVARQRFGVIDDGGDGGNGANRSTRSRGETQTNEERLWVPAPPEPAAAGRRCCVGRMRRSLFLRGSV